MWVSKSIEQRLEMRWRERDGGLGCVNWTRDRATKLDLMVKDMPEQARASRRAGCWARHRRWWLLVLGFEVENGRGETALPQV